MESNDEPLVGKQQKTTHHKMAPNPFVLHTHGTDGIHLPPPLFIEATGGFPAVKGVWLPPGFTGETYARTTHKQTHAQHGFTHTTPPDPAPALFSIHRSATLAPLDFLDPHLAEEGDLPDRPTINVDLAPCSPDTPDATETQFTFYRAVVTNSDTGAINRRHGANFMPAFLSTTT